MPIDVEHAMGEIQAVSDVQGVNGGPFWSRADGNFPALAGFSTLLVLNVLGEIGAPSSTTR